MNSMNTQAHESVSLLQNVYVKSSNKLTLRMKLKLLQFMERLSGPKIGFYLWDIKSITNLHIMNVITITIYYNL